MAQILRLRISFVLLLRKHLSWLLLTWGRNVLRSLLTGVIRSREEVATLRIVFRKLRLALALALALAPVIMSRVWRWEEVSVSEVRLVGHVVYVHPSLQQRLNTATSDNKLRLSQI